MQMHESVVQSLWIGEKLSNIELLSINSFVKRGHLYHLYVYEIPKNVPSKVILKDASTTIKWYSSKAKKLEVHINSSDGQLLKSLCKNCNINNNKKFSNNTVLYLQDVSNNLPLHIENTLARVTIKVFQSNYIKM